MATQTKADPKLAAPSERQREALLATNGGRTIKVDDVQGRKKITVLTRSGQPVKEQPKLDRAALERCAALDWLNATRNGDATVYTLSADGMKAKRRK